ncbi:MAG: DUF2142 domain-containing protein [Acidimicrobiales bacterium]
MRHRQRMLVVALLAGLSVCWVFATPLFGISDEPAQVMKAAAVVRGQFVGTPDGGPNTIVRIPEDLVGPDRLPCFMFRPTVDAGCEAPLGHDNAVVPEETWVGYYPPFYYLVVGWPSLLFQGAVAVYAMRVVAALLGAVLLAFAFLSAADARGRALLVPALAALATPYVLVYMATVNPSGMELSSALCAWTSGAALANGPPPDKRRGILVRFVIGLAVLTQVRDLGPIFAGVVVLALVCWYGVRASAELLRRRAVKLMVAGIGACAVFASVWVLVVAKLNFVGNSLPKDNGFAELLWLSTLRFAHDLLQLVGSFGWTDTSPPPWVTALGLAIMAGLAILGFAAAARRPRAVVAGLLVCSFLLPVLLVAVEARHEGILGQGRYWLPLLAGVLLVAAEAGGAAIERPSRLLWSAVAVSEVVIDVVCFQVALDRFRFGVGRPEIAAGWNPPGGGDPWPIVYGALTLAFAYWWWSLGSPRGAVTAHRRGGARLRAAFARFTPPVAGTPRPEPPTAPL